MSRLAIVRAAHLNLYLGLLREIGVPTERALASCRLPSGIEAMPEAYVSIERAMDCVFMLCRDVSMMELGFLALSQQPGLDTVNPAFRAAVLAAPTGRARLDTFVRLALSEDSALSFGSRREGANVRVLVDLPDARGHPALCLAEWLNLKALLSVLGSVAGAQWRPAEITFVSGGPASGAMQEAFAGTRFRFGEAHTSVLFEASLLQRPCPPEPALAACKAATPGRPLAEDTPSWSFAALLRELVRPYLDDGYPEIGLFAEIVGMSRRTLQRRLAESGRTYSHIVQEARFDLARDLLLNTDARVIDVAFMAGYQNPQHFSRAFRKLAGVSPRTFRQGAGATL